MTAEHRKIHSDLHGAFTELVADYLTFHPDKLMVDTTLMELLEWSYEQTICPSELLEDSPMVAESDICDELLNKPKRPQLQAVRRGWRSFKCSHCDYAWDLPTRDHLSPSVETCPHCFIDAYPYARRPDAALPIDELGNLTLTFAPNASHTVSPWEVIDGYAATRTLYGQRVAFIEKTPRILDRDTGEWLFGPKGAGGNIEQDGETIYGFYQPSRDWCDIKLREQGYPV